MYPPDPVWYYPMFLIVLFIPMQVPLVLPIIVTVLAIYLLIAPIVDAPTFGYLYAGIVFLAGLLIYYPMVYRGYSPKFMGKI